VESNDCICEVCVQTHSRRQGNWHVRAESHHDGGEGGNGSGSGDEIAVDNRKTGLVAWVVVATRHARGALAGAAAVGEDSGIDLDTVSCRSEDGCRRAYRDDVGHGEEGRQAGSNLRQEARVLPLIALCDVRFLQRRRKDRVLTCPEPSRRKRRPTKLFATRSLMIFP
jgi:hypothetical protein